MKFEKAAAYTRKFIEDHKVAIAVIVTTLVAVKVNKIALKDHEDFMEKHGILELYYTQTDDE